MRQMESLVREMQDPENGVPVRSQKLFLTSIPSAFMGQLDCRFYVLLVQFPILPRSNSYPVAHCLLLSTVVQSTQLSCSSSRSHTRL